MIEIERKFLIDHFPDLPLLKKAVVYQGYLSTEPVVRIRSMETDLHTSYVLCIKGEGKLARKEIELSLTKEIFDDLKELLNYPMVKKDYRIYQLPGKLKLECSLVDRGEPTEFMYAEVEFPSLEEAAAFVPPSFLGRDVTEEDYGMGAYWKRKYEI